MKWARVVHWGQVGTTANWLAHNLCQRSSWHSALVAWCYGGSKAWLARSSGCSSELQVSLFSLVASSVPNGCHSTRHHILHRLVPKARKKEGHFFMVVEHLSAKDPSLASHWPEPGTCHLGAVPIGTQTYDTGLVFREANVCPRGACSGGKVSSRR